MQLEHSFTVPVPVADAWKVLLDIEQIAPCMPGAVLDSIDGDEFTGRVKVKLGPISLTYKGKASFVKKDEATHTAVIDAAGKDQRGNGTAAATVTASLTDQGVSSTRVDVLTDLKITGKPAQFGRGVMTDVGNKLIWQFASCVEQKLSGPMPAEASDLPAESVSPAGADLPVEAPAGPTAADDAAAGGADSASRTPASRTPAVAREPEPIDLLDVAGGSVLTRFGIPAAGLAAAIAILYVIIRQIRS